MTHHFVQRCRERGIASIDGMALRRNIERAIAEHSNDLVEFVFHIDAVSSVWRFRVKEGVFYAVCGRHSQRCITLYDRSILREVRQSRRFRMRVSGKREREIAK